MTAALNIASSALQANTTAIDTVSENVANAQTPGYVRESANLAALPSGPFGVGSGVAVVSVGQATDALLAATTMQAQGALATLGTLQQTLSAAENIFPIATAASATAGTGATPSNSIAGQLASFWSSWDSIVQSPSSSAPRVQVIDAAQGLASALNEASTQLSQIATNALAQLTQQLSQTNALLSQAAALNVSIAATEGAGGTANQLKDQLHAVLQTLAQLAGVSVRTQPGGTVTISIGGVAVVQGANASTLSRATHAAQAVPPASPPRSTWVVVTTSGTLRVPVSSGSMAGLLTTVNTYLPAYQTQLDGVANALKSVVNDGLAQGYTATGASGANEPLFVGTGAAGIALNHKIVTDPSLLAASNTTTPKAAANNGANAQKMAELGTPAQVSALGAGLVGPDALYRTMVQNMGSDTQSMQRRLAAQTSVTTQAQASLQAVTGVDVTSELTNLLSFQQNYEASAKLLSVVATTVQSLLQAVA